MKQNHRPAQRRDAESRKGASKPVTIHDVARAAGVSPKTVSRVVNHETYVAQATRARVNKAIAEFGYYPHTGAQSLRTAPSGCIGVTFSAPLSLVPISEALLSFLFSHLYRLFGASGIEVTFDFGPGMEDLRADYARGLWTRRCGALVVMGPLANHDSVIEHVHASGHPYVTTSRIASLLCSSSAVVDLDAAAYLSAKYLLERGHRRIALLTAFEGYTAGQERHDGYARALRETGIAVDERLIRCAGFAHDQLSVIIHRLVMDSEVTALIDSSACEDAEGIREGMRRAGRVPGESMEIVCWTYTGNAAVMSEASAHVWIPVREALVEGLEELLRWFSGEREGPIQVVYRPTLYETKGLTEISKPKPVFVLSR